MSPPLARTLVLCTAAAILSASPAAAMPDFVPSPGGIYEDFTALGEPRTEVPVGALWVQGYGPTGEGAAADNLLTIKSLTGVTINRETHLGLFSGILNLFGVDPSYRSRVSIRLGDVTIVRVKDMSKLTDPPAEPRIYEALRAGTIMISTESDVGLDLDTRAAGQRLPVVGRADTGRKRSFSIDGRDMFIAYRVATLKSTQSDDVALAVGRKHGRAEATIGGYRVRIAAPEVADAPGEKNSSCSAEPEVRVILHRKDSVAGDIAAPQSYRSVDGKPLQITLPVPEADGKGGLYTSVVLKNEVPQAHKAHAASVNACGAGEAKFTAYLQGTRLQTLSSPRAPSW